MGATGPAGSDGQGGVTTAGADVAIVGSGTITNPYLISSRTYTIGLWPELGGYVFWISVDGKHGLVAETQDQSDFVSWYEAQNVISNPGNHSLNGRKFRDWRIPTKHELNEMYLQRAAIGGFDPGWYLSITEFDSVDMWMQDFSDGVGFSISKYNQDYVRAVRVF